MKIVHIVAVMPATESGVAKVVAKLARETVRLGHETTIATVAEREEADGSALDEATAAGAGLVRFVASAVRAGVVHVHSDWTYPVWWRCGSAVRFEKRT